VNEASQSVPVVSLDEFVRLRQRTERVSAFLAKRLRAHLGLLYPILAPGRVFGKHIGSREVSPRADEAFTQLTTRYKEACGRPFDLRQDLDDEAVAAMEYGVDIYPWEYLYQLPGAQGNRTVSVTSPVRWIVTYRCDYTPGAVRTLLATKGQRRVATMRQFVVNALAIQVVMGRTAGLNSLFNDLRYEIQPETDPAFGNLKLLTVSAPIRSFRPADDLIAAATGFSGVPSFIELIDETSVESLRDPLQRELQELLRSE
jgi:hypothetical protein